MARFSDTRIILTSLIVTCLFLNVALAKSTKSESEKDKTKAAKKKLKLRHVVSRLTKLESSFEELSTKLSELDEAKGVFSDDPPCPVKSTEGFTHSKELGSCYRMEPADNLMNWTVAQDFCASLHRKAHLVAIETEAEQKFLKAKWHNECGLSTLSRFWTDGSKEDEDAWLWKTGRTDIRTTYQHWIATTRRDDARFNCLAVYALEGYTWGDVACWVPHMVTCEIEL